MDTPTRTDTSTVPTRPHGDLEIRLMLQTIDDLNDTIRSQQAHIRQLQDEQRTLRDDVLGVYHLAVESLDDDVLEHWSDAYRQAEIEFGFDPDA